MSTKIYNAYRISFQARPNILNFLWKLRIQANQFLKESPDVLRKLHFASLEWGEEVNLSKEKMDVLKALKSNRVGFLQTLKKYLEYEQNKKTLTVHRTTFDPYLSVAIFMDTDFWYLKFFPNQQWHHQLIDLFEEYPLDLEDYHYQNQTDPPEDIPTEEYKNRKYKWDSFMHKGTFQHSMTYEISNAQQICDMLRENIIHKDCLSLSYKFDATPRTLNQTLQ